MASEPFVKFRVPEIPGLRDQGRFTAAISQQRDLNRDLGLAIQQRVVLLMRNRIAFGERASASTGRLLQATADSRNLQVQAFSFGVGIPRFLDGSVAKYWRTFEEGSAAVWKRPFVGTQLLPIGRFRGPTAHGARPGVRTATSELPFLQGRYIVKREIQPADIYGQVFREGFIQREAAAGAVKYLNRVLGNEIRPSGGYFTPR